MTDNKSDALSLRPDDDDLAVIDPNDQTGKENIDREDITLPRIALAQKTSPQIEKGKPEYIEGLHLFQLFNTMTEEVYGEGPLKFVILRMDKRAMQFDQNNAVVDFDVPIFDPRLKFSTDADGNRVKPTAVLFYDYLILLSDSMMPAVLSLKGTGVKVAKKLNAWMKLYPGPAWARQYSLSAAKGTSGSFSYGVYRVTPAGVTPRTLAAIAKRTSDQLKGHRVEVEDRETPMPVDTEAIPF